MSVIDVRRDHGASAERSGGECASDDGLFTDFALDGQLDVDCVLGNELDIDSATTTNILSKYAHCFTRILLLC